ncbi:MAG: hypothetical protein GY845_34720 [Planctomycetes bacterium]|nr:hypothetical protein [Planctomycetota bacterium]
MEESQTVTGDTVLMGSGSNLDSLGVVTLITDIEDRLQEELNADCYLVLDEISHFDVSNPVLTVDILAQYISHLSEGFGD